MSAKKPRERRMKRNTVKAWIVSPFLDKAMACDLVDLSASGAKIRSEAGDQIPPSFGLRRVPRSVEVQACEMVWRRGQMIGVKYI